jgi:hypothetical protein
MVRWVHNTFFVLFVIRELLTYAWVAQTTTIAVRCIVIGLMGVPAYLGIRVFWELKTHLDARGQR